MDRVKNKIVLITGGGRGIGKSAAQLFADEGATVIIADICKDDGEALAKNIGGQFYYLDICNEKHWQQIITDIDKKFDRLDILFNNAGITGINENLGPQDPENISLKAWRYIHQINLDGVFLGCKYGISLMKKHGGSIINMSSRSAMVGIPSASAYASSKAAVRNFTKTVALYCASKEYNIRCNSLHPGAILTPIWDKVFGEDKEKRQKMLKEFSASIPLGHMGTPKDVAYAALYLGSDESKYVTGAEFVLDGGILAGNSAAQKKV